MVKMKIKYFFALFIFSAMPITAQEKLEVFFDFDKSEINTAAMQKLVDWAEHSNGFEVKKIYGFCDWKGTNPYNDTLSVKRVHSIYNFLRERNVKIKDDYEIRGFGEDSLQSNVHSANRKVTVVFGKIKEQTEEAVILEELNQKMKIAKAGDLIKLKNIYFFNNSPKLVPKSKPILYELLCIMSDNPKLKIEIQGHICCQTVAGQYDVSIGRAKAIYNFLVQNKVDRKRLSYKGYGITRPIHPIPEKSEQEENENRRVEILIVENQ